MTMPIPIELKPTSQHRVIDLVRQAGVDVSDWSDYKHGAKSPGANPNYCYEWAFVQPEPLVRVNGPGRRRDRTAVQLS